MCPSPSGYWQCLRSRTGRSSRRTPPWQTGATSSQGVCLQSGRSFASTYLLQGHLGIVVYEIRPDGSMLGRWFTGGTGAGVGTESLTPQ